MIGKIAIAAVAGSLFLAVAAPAQASPRSSALIDEGIVELQRGEYRDALTRFLAASVADPQDSEAQFFQGVALNRLGLHKEALGQIELARRGGVTNAEMDFEYGWALLGTGRYGDAVQALSAYKAANPDSAKASELVGRAELARGNTAAAEAAFDDAVTRDPSLRASVDFFRASEARERGDTLRSAELANDLSSSQAGPLAQTLRQQQRLFGTVERPQRSGYERPRPWNVFGAVAVGRNSNVIALSEDIARPADITRTDSRYYDLTAGGEYRIGLDPTQWFTAGGILNHRNYRDISGNDTHTASLFLRYNKQIDPRWFATLTGSFTHVRVDGEKRQNISAISPRIEARVTEQVTAGVFYTAQKINTPDPTRTPANLDTDSKLQTAGGDIRIAFPGMNTDVTFGAAVMNNSAVGSDYDYVAHRFSGTVRTLLPYDVTAGIGFTRTSYDYKNLNSLAPTTPAGPTGFGFARDDTITTYRIELSRPINDMFTVYARAAKTNANSNLNVFTYDQKDVQLGVTVRF